MVERTSWRCHYDSIFWIVEYIISSLVIIITLNNKANPCSSLSFLAKHATPAHGSVRT